jgi:hypothetical protein
MYRHGTSAHLMFREIGKISEKLENGVHCLFPKHGRTNDLELSYKNDQQNAEYLTVCNNWSERKPISFLIDSFLMPFYYVIRLFTRNES